MDLKNVLENIFRAETNERVDEIYKALRRARCNTTDDLKYLNGEILEDTILEPVELNKLLSYIRDMKRNMSLGEALEKIFGVRNPEKLEEIKGYFEAHEVYTSEDLAIFDFDMIGNHSSIFTQHDIMKIRNYIRKEHPDNFKELKEKEDQAKKIEALDHEGKEARMTRYLDFLYSRMKVLDEDESDLKKKFAELMIAQTQSSGRSNVNSGDSTFPSSSGIALITTIGSRVNPYLAIGVVANDMIDTFAGLYSEYNRSSKNSSDAKKLKDLLKVNRKEKKKVIMEINKLVSERYGKDFDRSLSLGARKQLEY